MAVPPPNISPNVQLVVVRSSIKQTPEKNGIGELNQGRISDPLTDSSIVVELQEDQV
ncbi:MAG: hypothetical protein OXI44_01485 [Bacteroidota bacterium]|nr:hypothetical protein [Bacteroidota bacterium]